MQIDALHGLKIVLVGRRIAKLLICDDVRPLKNAGANRPQKLRPSSVTDQMERGGARAWKGRRTVSEICSGWKSTTHLCGWLMGVASNATAGKVDDAVRLSAAQMAQKS